MAGCWEFPGGKLEAGENPEKALVRELKEELDITVDPNHLQPATFASHHYNDFHLFMPVFIVRCWQGKARGKEGQDIRWFSFHELQTKKMPPPDSQLVHNIECLLKVIP